MAKKSTLLIVIVGLLVLVGVIIYVWMTYFRTPGNSKASQETASSSSKSSSSNQFQQYHNKILTIASTDGKLKGEIGIKVEELEGGYPLIKTATFLMINDELPLKTTSNGTEMYSYFGNLTTADQARSDDTGNVNPAWCAKNETIDILDSIDNFATATNKYLLCRGAMAMINEPTSVFFNHFTRTYTQYEFNYEQILNQNKFYVFDASSYWPTDAGSTGNYSGPDLDTAVSTASIAAEYDVVVSE